MSFFLWFGCRWSENSTLTDSLLSIFKKSVDFSCVADIDEYNSIVGQNTEYLPSDFTIYRIKRFN